MLVLSHSLLDGRMGDLINIYDRQTETQEHHEAEQEHMQDGSSNQESTQTVSQRSDSVVDNSNIVIIILHTQSQALHPLNLLQLQITGLWTTFRIITTWTITFLRHNDIHSALARLQSPTPLDTAIYPANFNNS